MKFHVFELRRMIRRYVLSSQLCVIIMLVLLLIWEEIDLIFQVIMSKGGNIV